MLGPLRAQGPRKKPASVVRHPGRVTDDLRITSRLLIPAAELTERFSRSTGPGGQSVNTTDSRVELSFDVAASPSLNEQSRRRALARLHHRLTAGVVTVAASRQRSQLANRREARERLTALLADAVAAPPPMRRPTKPSKAVHQRRLAGKKHRSKIKQRRRKGDPGEG